MTTSNYQGEHYFLNIQTVCLIARYKFTAHPIPNRINKMVSRMARRYPAGFEITYRRGNAITDDDTTNDDDADSDYDPSENDSDTSDPPIYASYDNSTDNEFIANLYDDDTVIILNPEGVDHHEPVARVVTNYENLHAP